MQYKEIALDYQARKEIENKIAFPAGEPEMTEKESAFLCGLINRFMPHNIVEVGVAGGGTSAILTQCLMNQNRTDVTLHSVDCSKQFYRDASLETGYLGKQADEVLAIPFTHKYHLGDVACAYEEELGTDIDFLILDTMHRMPGEVLDFLSLLPLLKDGCVVVLHDISLQLHKGEDRNAFATGLLFSCVAGEKILPLEAEKDIPNIAAFVVNEETGKTIENVFLSLLVTWNYVPEMKQLQTYRQKIRKYYETELVTLFDEACKRQSEAYAAKEKEQKNILWRIRKAARLLIKGGI